MEPEMIQTNAMATRPADAQTILSQIGADVLTAISAKGFVSTGDGVMFFAGRNRKVIVKLGALDLYAVETVKIDRKNWTFTSTYFVDGVYADTLATVVAVAASL